LLFWPWFVEFAFQRHYRCSTLHLADAVSLPVSLLIWVACLAAVAFSGNCKLWHLLTVLVPAAYESRAWHHKYNDPERYNKRRTAITVLRRVGILPYIAFVLLRQPVHAPTNWQAAFTLLCVGSGSAHTLIMHVFFLNSWWVAIAEGLLSVLLLASAAPSGCRSVLAGPHTAGWGTAAAVFDRATLGIWRRSLEQPDMAQGVCCTTLNTTLVRGDGRRLAALAWVAVAVWQAQNYRNTPAWHVHACRVMDLRRTQSCGPLRLACQHSVVTHPPAAQSVINHIALVPLLQVMVTCMCGYLVHWFERSQRLKFKRQVPPAVAAMQKHLYGLPTGLKVAQVCVQDTWAA
jgi:hypothetical protein